jgi:hypothetical protein
MWSPTLLFDRRAYGPEKLSSVTQKDFCNTIGTFETCRRTPRMSVYWGRPEVVGARPKRRFLTPRGRIQRRQHSESVNCDLAPSRTRHSDLVGNLSPSLAGNREFALARRIYKLNWRRLGKTDIDEIARIIDLELKRLPR